MQESIENNTTANQNHKIRNNVITVILILVASIVAILSKILLPSDVNDGDFDSVFVKIIGFPVVASLYFIMIYSHNAIVTRIFAKQTKIANFQVGLRFGICFALIYLFGMQEVVVEASPFSQWGLPFIFYQFVMGIGEAIAALLLCLAIAKLTCLIKSDEVKTPVIHQTSLLIFFITIAFTLERTISCEAEIIASEVSISPVPHYLWTIVFGFILSICFVVIYPVFYNDNSPVMACIKSAILTIGLSWMIFNLFIGLIFDGALADVLLRSGLDVIAIFTASLLWTKVSRV